MVYQAKYQDIGKIQSFIKENFRENHVLAECKALVVHEYFDGLFNLDENNLINFYYYKNNDDITAILGFFDYKNKTCLSMWSSKPKSFDGLKLLKEVEKIKDDKDIVIVGLSEMAMKIYKSLGYSIKLLNHYYYINEKYQEDQDTLKCQSNVLFESNLFVEEEYQRRVINNPFRDYYLCCVDDTQFTYRLIDNKVALIVDVLGSTESLETKIIDFASNINAMEVQIYINKELSLEIATEQSYCISDFDSNPKIEYAYKNEDDMIITKLWGDQDRIAILDSKYAIVNNFMYHYIRDDNSVTYKKTTDEFKNDIKILKSKYSNITIDQLVNENYDANDEYFMMSFDDYYIEHEEVAVPLLKKEGLSGVFFVPAFKAGEEVLLVNVVQQLVHQLGIDKLSELLKSNGIEVLECDNKTFDSNTALNIKRTLQNKEQEFARKLYEECEKVKLYGNMPSETLTNEMYLGNHLSTHSHLTELTNQQVQEEINTFEERYKMQHKIVAYPYGSYNNQILEIFEAMNYQYGWTTQRGYSIISSKANLKLNRFDANDVILINKGE